MAVWFRKWRIWFKSTSIDPTDEHISRKELEEWCMGQTIYTSSLKKSKKHQTKMITEPMDRYDTTANRTDAMTVPGPPTGTYRDIKDRETCGGLSWKHIELVKYKHVQECAVKDAKKQAYQIRM